MLRRPKTAITLPPRRNQLYPVELTHAERTFYNDIRTQALVKIDEAMHEDVTGRARTNIYANALQKIETLRLVCDLGLHYHTRRVTAGTSTVRDQDRKGKRKADLDQGYSSSEEEAWATSAQYVFNSQRGVGPMECIQCGLALELTEAALVDEGHGLLTRCLKFICADCTKKLHSVSSLPIATTLASPSPLRFPATREVKCGHQPACPVASISTNDDAWEDMANVSGMATDGSPNYLETDELINQLPSKVEMLLADLRAQPPGTKW